jgi:hypothetical protein
MENTGATPVRWIRLHVVENQSSKPGIYAERRAVWDALRSFGCLGSALTLSSLSLSLSIQVFSWSGNSPEYLLRLDDEPLQPGHTLPVTVEIYG